MEPPVADLSRRRTGRGIGSVETGRLAAAVAAAALVLASSGDALLVAVLVGVAAADGVVFGVGALAAVGTLLRWGSSSLPALAGAQAVLGPAAVTGSEVAVASSVSAALSLMLTPALVAHPRAAVAVPAGAWAGLVVAGPAATTTGDFAVRAAGVAAGIALAMAAGRWVPRRLALPLSGALALAGVVLAAAS